MPQTINLMLGLPVEIVQDKPEAQAVLRKLRSWVIGDHQFMVDDQSVAIQIKQIKAIAQPVGTYFAWGANTM